MAITTTIPYNVTLTAEQQELVKVEVLEKRNKIAACKYAGIRVSRMASIVNGGLLKAEERDRLINFCYIVNGGKPTTNTTTHAETTKTY